MRLVSCISTRRDAVSRWFHCAGLLLLGVAGSAAAQSMQVDIPGPAGSSAFGTAVTVLPGGNIVVSDPTAAPANAGAVHLYSPDGQLLSSLIGGPEDRVGSGGVSALADGNFVVLSPLWGSGGAATGRGAVTWVNGSSGVAATVSAANSLVGSAVTDRVGSDGVVALPNGSYLVRSGFWANGVASNAGAVTWVPAGGALFGEVSAANSLVGASQADTVGQAPITVLGDGDYVVSSPSWSNAGTLDVGAATWGSGSSGVTGAITAANSLVGTTAGDALGSGGVVAVGSGNYVVASPLLDLAGVVDAGAATWCSGSSGRVGSVGSANSLFGTHANDRIGGNGIVALRNGNYVVRSSEWDDGLVADVGAATWGNGATGIVGAVGAANSLVGSIADDLISLNGVIALTNGHYVVLSSSWTNGNLASAGAATWADGSSGLSGRVSAANSLVGTHNFDLVGSLGTALRNGNYVICSDGWRNGAEAFAGAATWADGSTGRVGPVSAENSLVGTVFNQVVCNGVVALANGNYVVRSAGWVDGVLQRFGYAVTWGNGVTGLVDKVTPQNSLVGKPDDRIGIGGVLPLMGGDYVVLSPLWRNFGQPDAGAATWGSGTAGVAGWITAQNSLLGDLSADSVGATGAALADGDYVVGSPRWDRDALVDAGAVTLARGSGEQPGPISAANSVLGTVALGGPRMVYDYDSARHQLVVGQPAANRISLFTLGPVAVFADGFEP